MHVLVSDMFSIPLLYDLRQYPHLHRLAFLSRYDGCVFLLPHSTANSSMASASSGKQWIRKSPDHLRWLESLLKAFPDARIVMLLREPREVVSSFCRLVLNFRSGFSESVNAKSIGRDALSRLSDNIERMMIARAADPCPSRYYDLQYSDLLENPVDAVHRLCDYFGLSVSGAFETELRAYAKEKPHQKDKFGGHQYSAESFRLDSSHVDSLFQFYRERYISTGCRNEQL